MKPRSWDIQSYTRQYKLPEFEAKEAHKQILEMKEQGLVTENHDCSYNSAVFIIKNENNTLRMVAICGKLTVF